MKMLWRTVIFLVFVLLGKHVRAQDTLPDFSVVNRNGKIILSWVNDYPVIKQLSIQRSEDSTKGFKTILTLPDPTSVTNGFLDNNAPSPNSFYKLYILLDNGKYTFSKAQKAKMYTAPPAKTQHTKPASPVAKEENKNNTAVAVETKLPEKIAPVEAAVPAVADEPASKEYQMETTNTSNKKRSDGLKKDSVNVVRPEAYKPSGFVFTNADGNVTIVLPSGRHGKFKIKFYEQSGDAMFQINDIKEHIFVLDKSNFLHSGWFRFELFEDGILKEKNKVRVP